MPQPEPLKLNLGGARGDFVLGTSTPHDFPAEPETSYPNGPNCSRYGGTPILPSQKHYDDYESELREYQKQVQEYPAKLRAWIDKNKENEEWVKFANLLLEKYTS